MSTTTFTNLHRALALMPGEGRSLAFFGATVTYKVVSADTGGACSLFEYTAPPHFAGPPAHWHKVTQEVFYVLEGTVTFRLGELVVKGTPGAFVYIPTGVVHSFANEESTPARFLGFLSPAGLEQFFVELAALAQSEPTWPPKDLIRLEALRKQYDQYSPDEL